MNDPTKTLDDCIAQYLEAIDRGESPDPAEFVVGCDEVRAEFLRFIRLSGGVERLTTAGRRRHSAAEVTLASLGSEGTPNRSLDSAQQSPPALPKSIAHYDVVRELGRGGMGIVYLARNRNSDQVVALKVLRTSLSQDRTFQERLRRESIAFGSLQHNHVVRLVETGVDAEGVPYLAMEMVDGIGLDCLVEALRISRKPAGDRDVARDVTREALQTLETSVTGQSIQFCVPELRNGHYLSWIALRIADIAEALHEAHEQGTIHRDVKPSNILIDTEGKAWLTDFGLAAIGDELTSITGSHDLLGTLAFMSPEQARGSSNRAIDRRSDIFSLGATLFNATVFEKPFNGTRAEILSDLLQGRHKLPSKLNREIPHELDAIICRAMAFSPRDRFQTASDFASELRRFARGQQIKTRLPGFTQQVFRWCEKKPLVASAVAGGVIVAIAAVLLVQLLNSISIRGLNRDLEKTNKDLVATNDALQHTERRLRRELYVADLSIAFEEYDRGKYSTVRSILDRYRDVPDAHDDPRGTAWRLLDRLTQMPVPHVLGKHDAAATEVAISADGAFAFSAGHDGSIRRFSLRDRQEEKVFQIGGELDAFALEPTGRGFVTGKNIPQGFNEVGRYSAETGEAMIGLFSHSNHVESIAVSPSGEWMASADRYNEAVVYDASGRIRSRWSTESRNESLAFVDDDHILVTQQTENARTVKLWNLTNGEKKLVRTPRRSEYFSLSAKADGGGVRRYVGANTEDIFLLEWPKLTELARLEGVAGRIRCVDIASDGKGMACGTDGGTVYFWDLRNWQPNNKLEFPDPFILQASPDRITSVKVLPNVVRTFEGNAVQNAQVITSDATGAIQVWELPSNPVSQWNPTQTNSEAGFGNPMHDAGDPNGLYIPFSDGRLVRFDMSDQSTQLICTLDQPITGDGMVDGTRRRAYLPVASGIAEVKLEHPFEVLRILPVKDAKQSCQGIVLINDRLIACFNDHLAAYDIASGELERTLPFPSEGTTQFLKHPDGQFAVIVGLQEGLYQVTDEVRHWREAEVAADVAHWVEFSPDGRLLAEAQHDWSVRVSWLDGSQREMEFTGHQGYVSAMLFLDDNRVLATGSYDSTIRFWDIATGRTLGVLKDVRNSRLLFTTPDGSRLISGRWGESLSVWDLK